MTYDLYSISALRLTENTHDKRGADAARGARAQPSPGPGDSEHRRPEHRIAHLYSGTALAAPHSARTLGTRRCARLGALCCTTSTCLHRSGLHCKLLRRSALQ